MFQKESIHWGHNTKQRIDFNITTGSGNHTILLMYVTIKAYLVSKWWMSIDNLKDANLIW